MPTKQEIRQTLERILYDAKEQPSFRGNQEEIVNTLLSGSDVLAILPTGAGKTVCYQVPAFLLPGLTIIISPLVSLIEDQVEKLLRNPDKEISGRVACISSSFVVDKNGKHVFRKKSEREKGEKSFTQIKSELLVDASKGAYKILYVTAERIRRADFIQFAKNTEISLIVADEAHCISMYGYEFRPRYLEIARLFSKTGKHPLTAAFTATATKAVVEDIKEYLDMNDPVLIQAKEQKRDNLTYSVKDVEDAVSDYVEEHKGVRPDDAVFRVKMKELRRFLKKHQNECGLVYCNSVTNVNRVYKSLSRSKKHSVTRYYADLDNDLKHKKGWDQEESKEQEEENEKEKESKEKNFKAFLNGEKNVVVSTTALGMGIDKKDVRFVFHFNLPLCIENYIQESGRAGRDGNPSECFLCYDPSDLKTCETLINQSMAESELSKSDREKRRKIAGLRLVQMKKYAESFFLTTSEERQRFLLEYLDTFDPQADDEELKKEHLEVNKTVRKIDVLYCNRTKVSNEIRKGKCSGTGLTVASTDEYVSTVSFRIRDGDKDAPPGTLSYFDMMVADAVYTLRFHNVKTVTPRAVMGLLSGNLKIMLQPERKKRVEDSLRKMIGLTIDIYRKGSVYVGFSYDDSSSQTTLSGSFLPLAEDEKGRFSFIEGAPFPLYDYAEITNGQFYTFPFRFLNVPFLPASDFNLELVHYLLCRLDMMSSSKRERKTKARIRIRTVYETLGVSFPEGKYERERKEITVIQRIVFILEFLKEKRLIREWIPENWEHPEYIDIVKWKYEHKEMP